MRKQILRYLFLALIFLACSEGKEKETSKIKANGLGDKIDLYIGQMMKTHEIPGMAVAIIGADSIIHKGFYGKASLEVGEPITNNSVFKIFSLTKTMVATGVFKLVEGGKISLDDKLSDHFSNLPLKWRAVSIANLLSHSSGLPDIRKYEKELGDDDIDDKEFIELLYNDEMEFVTGTNWNYNQTNFILLKRLIEKVSSTSFETFILNHQFPNADPLKVFFSSDPFSEIENGAKYYNYDKETNSFVKKPEHAGKKNHPLAGIHITLDEYVSWNNRLDSSMLIDESTKNAMWSPFHFTDSGREFLHGWDVYKVNGNDSYGFSGGGVSGYRKFLKKGLSIIVLTTGYRYYAVQDLIIDRLAGMVDKSLEDQESILKEKVLGKYFLSGEIHRLENVVAEIKIDYPNRNLEEVLKSVGYELFFSLERKEEAIRLFELNVLEYPKSYDTHGSLAYLQFLTDQFELSRTNYVKALELNPENSYSERRIKEIDEMKE